jgi:hypothetical protein
VVITLTTGAEPAGDLSGRAFISKLIFVRANGFTPNFLDLQAFIFLDSTMRIFRKVRYTRKYALSVYI